MESDFKLTMANFSPILKEAVNESLVLKPNFIKWAFRKTGIHPFDPKNVDFSKLKTRKEDSLTSFDSNEWNFHDLAEKSDNHRINHVDDVDLVKLE